MRLELPGKIKARLEESTFSGSSLVVGDPTNYTQIESDGSVRHFGDATVHDDLVQAVDSTKMFVNQGKVDYNFDNLWAVMEEGGSLDQQNDWIFLNYQMSHATKANSIFKLHFHWSQSSDTVRTISGKYRIQNQGSGTTTVWETFSATTEFGGTGDNVYDTSEWDYGTDGNFNQITRLVDIPLTGLGVSAIIQVVLARTDANANSDVYVYSVDGHIEKDSLGSRQEYTK